MKELNEAFGHRRKRNFFIINDVTARPIDAEIDAAAV
jgi:hypothetical protein